MFLPIDELMDRVRKVVQERGIMVRLPTIFLRILVNSQKNLKSVCKSQPFQISRLHAYGKSLVLQFSFGLAETWEHRGAFPQSKDPGYCSLICFTFSRAVSTGMFMITVMLLLLLAKRLLMLLSSSLLLFLVSRRHKRQELRLKIISFSF